jgi:NADH-quinone oxidoreductase subunit M
MSILLLLLLVIPLVGALVCAFLPARSAKGWALLVSLATAAAGAGLAWSFNFHQTLPADSMDPINDSVQIYWPVRFATDIGSYSISDIGFSFLLGIDSISLWLILLTVLLTPLALLASFDSIKERSREYYGWMLVLLAAMNGVFMARDALLFYVFFELTLVPMFFIIGVWGGPERRYAAGKFFLFTFGGSIFTLAALLYLGDNAGSFNLSDITRHAQLLPAGTRFWLLLGLLAGFAVKVPLFPVHTWLPLAHTEAPTAGSVILAGVLLKLGTYGLLRLAVPIGLVSASGVLFPTLLQVLAILCLIGILYGALVAWVQQDIKKLVAYSSVSHLGFCVLGMLALNDIGLQGSLLYMINHGLSTGAMFLVIGMIYDRFHTRDINELSGLARRMPKMAFFFVFFVLSSIGLPGLNGFVSEFLTVLGAFTSEHLGIAFGVVAAIGVILGALYMLHMTARVIFGPLKFPGYVVDAHGHAHDTAHGHGAHAGAGQSTGMNDDHGHGGSTDINAREIGLLLPLAVAVILLGILPNSVLKTVERPLQLINTPLRGDLPTAAAPQAAPPLGIASAAGASEVQH